MKTCCYQDYYNGYLIPKKKSILKLLHLGRTFAGYAYPLHVLLLSWFHIMQVFLCREQQRYHCLKNGFHGDVNRTPGSGFFARSPLRVSSYAP